ncbi:MAG: hypothetical protein Q4D45_13010 [Lachnospiraceae bacterium]|nr:hypothetical protein [Lachnospiraceae bacterium]
MDLLDLYAKISLDSSEYDDGLGKTKEKGVSAFSTVVDTAKKAAKAGMAAGVAITTAAVKGYSNYEQLVGGVETLFGAGGQSLKKYAESMGKSTSEVSGKYKSLMSAQNKVLNDASVAYKTAGMSANEYMDTITGFSASLVQSLGGNTKKAAEVGNQAVIDMSDNANKMGTSMEMIQNAYQGFAKQNYTMLDNLKLGYGGTKTEMERLLADAGKLSGQKYDISSFADIVEAIHVVQDNLGITGTTAKEAATTIEGSANAAKASWMNVAVGLAAGEGNLDTLMKAALDSSVTFGQNIIPRIGTTLLSLGQVLVSYGPTLLQQGVDLASKMINGLANGIGANLPTFLATALPMILKFSEQLSSNASQLINAGLNLIIKLAQGIANGLPTLITYIPQIISNIANIINSNAPKLIITGGIVILTLAKGIIKSIPALIANFPKIISAIVSVWTAFNWLSLGKNVLTSITKGIKNLPGQLKSIASKAVSNVKSAFKGGGIGNVVKTVFNGVKTAISGVMTKAVGLVKSAVSKLKGALKFSWSLPKLKLPHISISGKFSLNPPKAPHFGISWYRKAMDNAMILNGPTVFGYSAASGNFLGGGEAGAEVVAGRDTLMNMIRDAASSGNAELLAVLKEIAERLNPNNLYNIVVKAISDGGFVVILDNREVGRIVRKYA